MDNYYGVTRSEEYLAHYGIKGMKWGVRKAIESGSARRLNRQFQKAQKKLAKLEKRAASGKKYAARAAGLGAAAGLAGATAIAGPARVTEAALKGAGKLTKGVGAGMDAVGRSLQFTKHAPLKAAGSAIQKAGKGVRSAGADLFVDGMTAGHNIANGWGKSHSISRGITGALTDAGTKMQIRAARSGNEFIKKAGVSAGVKSWKAGQAVNKANLNNNAYARIGAAALGAGLAAGAGYNAYRAATTKRAAKKAAAFRQQMKKSFAGTQYARQIGQGPTFKKKRR